MSQDSFPENPEYQIYDKKLDQVRRIMVACFPEYDDPNYTILGKKDEDIIAVNFDELLKNPRTIITNMLDNDGRVIATSISMPIGTMDPTREAESLETAHIYLSAVDPGDYTRPTQQRKGLSVPLMRLTFEDLKARNYKETEIDAKIEGGFADRISTTFSAAIVDFRDHYDYYPDEQQRWMRVDLSKIEKDAS